MAKRGENGPADAIDDALLQALGAASGSETFWGASLDTDDGDGDESDDDFELETMEDDDDDDEDEDDEEEDDEEDDDDDKERCEDDAPEVKQEPQDAEGDDELLALAAAAADDASAGLLTGDDTIAHRTRTKFSLVDVEIDSLESLLPPDPTENALLSGENEYQRFLASLLPTGDEEDNLSFLDEEDEEYRPEEEDDDEEEDGGSGRRRREDGSYERRDSVEDEEDEEDDDDDGEDPQAVRISKRELTELLWDSTQVKVPPTFPKTAVSTTRAGAMTTPDVSAVPPAHTAATAGVVAPGNDVSDKTVGSAGETAALERTVDDMKDAAAMKDLNGSVSPQQCIQLASQMHKHFQLLLQTFHMIATNEPKTVTDPELKALLPPGQRKVKPPVNKEQLDECAAMLRELQIRGKRALQYKAQVLSKLTTSNGPNSSAASSEQLGERRVTRSISAAHAAVAHPSMFDIVGSQSMEELTEAFERGCTVTERNQKLHKSMLELDKHILLNRKKRRVNPNPRKLMFMSSEDRLLLYGVKRYGVEPDAWTEIRETLIPTKDVSELSKRYRYLASRKKRAGGNEFKEFNNEVNARKKGMWMIEEDVRIARGVVEYFGDNRRFSRISSKYLPHRHRLEIRKRWERLKDLYRVEDGTVKEVDDTLVTRVAAREFAGAVKRFLEIKLRNKVVDIPAAVMAQSGKKTSGRGKTTGSSSKTTGKGSVKQKPPSQPQPATDEVNGCSVKNLHPALFFSSWAVIHPATLLERTCEHNWPAFIGEKRKDISSESTLDLVSRAAASRVEEEAASHRLDRSGRSERLEPIGEDLDEDEDDEPDSSGLDFSLDAVESDENDMDTAEEDESDFEREELLSSDADESESEYEQMELSDNDDEDDVDGDSIDEGDLSHEEDGDPALTAHGGAESEATPVKHTLRLENLREPGDMRARRALEALERRITGNQATVVDSATGFTPIRVQSSTFEPLAVDDVQFGDDDDLLAYEELRDSSSSEDDDDFEQDELQSSSDEESEEADTEDATRSKRSREVGGLQPLKRPKLHQLSTRCSDCGSSPCACASSRMRRLMERIEPRGASSQPPETS